MNDLRSRGGFSERFHFHHIQLPAWVEKGSRLGCRFARFLTRTIEEDRQGVVLVGLESRACLAGAMAQKENGLRGHHVDDADWCFDVPRYLEEAFAIGGIGMRR